MPQANDAVWISVLPDMSRFGSTMSKGVDSSADQAGKTAGSKFTGAFKSALKIGAVVGAGMAAAAGGAFLKESIREASNLGESLNAVNVTFGKSAEGITKLGKEAADAVGLSQSEFNGLAVQFSAFAKTIAGEGGNVTKTMDELTTRGADFASVMNLEVNEAMSLFQSGLAGETEPLRKFGIDLSAAAVEAHAYKTGITAAGQAMTENEKVQARYSLLMQQTAKTQGDFTNTSDSLANSQRRLGANWDNIQASVGMKLIPALEGLSAWVVDTGLPKLKDLGGTLKDIKGFFDDNKTVIGAATIALGSLVAVTQVHAAVLAVQSAGGLLAFAKGTRIVTTLVKTWTAVQWLLNAALTANPIGLVVAAIALLAAGLVLAWKKSETFRNVMTDVWETVKEKTQLAALWVADKVLWMAEKILGSMAKAFGWVPELGPKLKTAAAAIATFRENVNREMDAIRDEEVVVGFRVRREVVPNSGKGPLLPAGGAGGRRSLPPSIGGAMGGKLKFTPKTDGALGKVGSVAARAQRLAHDIAENLADRERRRLRQSAGLGPMGPAGRVLPRGSYRIGMPYLGYPGHYGADYPAPTGTPVYSPWPGRVVASYDIPGSNPYNSTPFASYGRVVKIAHDNGMATLFAHLSDRIGRLGAVAAGQMIGRVGMNGNATGPHLHFEARRNGGVINPASLGLFDNGGILRPGQLAYNGLSQPEAVLTPGQWSSLRSLTSTSAFSVQAQKSNALHMSEELAALRRDLTAGLAKVERAAGQVGPDRFAAGLSGASASAMRSR